MPIIPPYVDVQDRKRRAFDLLLLPVLSLICLIYGFYYALTAPYLTVQFLAPTAALTLLGIWALPDQRQAPFRAVRFLLSSLLICMVLWPNYLAISLPGLPWITLIRLTGIPMALLLLVCLSVSKRFRTTMMETLNAIPFVWKAFVALVVMQIVTLPFSKDFGESANKVVILQVTWTALFLISVYMFRIPGRATRYLTLISLLAIPVGIIAQMEYSTQHVLWLNDIPSFLKMDDSAAYLKSQFRFETGQYRTKSTFSTPLGLAEYMALVTPFFIFYAIQGKKSYLKVLSVLALVGAYLCIGFSGSRLGLVGMLVAGLVYLLFWALHRRRRLPSDLISTAVVVAYPAVFTVMVAAIMFVNAVHDRLLGGAEGSNQARLTQLRMAVPKLIANPIGHGTGMSGESLGYAEGAFITVDNYYITIAMDYGVVGLIAHFGMFYVAIFYATWYGLVYAPRSKDKEASLLVPLAVCLTVFVVIKFVLSQPDNHPIVFMMLGMVVALVYRLQQEPGLIPKGREAAAAQRLSLRRMGSSGGRRPRLS